MRSKPRLLRDSSQGGRAAHARPMCRFRSRLSLTPSETLRSVKCARPQIFNARAARRCEARPGEVVSGRSPSPPIRRCGRGTWWTPKMAAHWPRKTSSGMAQSSTRPGSSKCASNENVGEAGGMSPPCLFAAAARHDRRRMSGNPANASEYCCRSRGEAPY